VGWGNFSVGNLCWFFILILIRLTVFLPTQRNKFKIPTLVIALFFLSINIEDCCSLGQKGSLHQAKTMTVLNQNIQFPMSNHERNTEQTFTSVHHGRILSALPMASVSGSYDQLQETNNRGINNWFI
jgi:hypothetical protein